MFGMVGTSFAVGVAYTSLWYPKEWQGRALGIFGMGTAGASITPFIAPSMLKYFSESDPVNVWKYLPVIYGVVLLTMGIVFILFSKTKKIEAKQKQLKNFYNRLKRCVFGALEPITFCCLVRLCHFPNGCFLIL